MRRCEIFVHGIKAGILTESQNHDEYRFEYEADYLADSNNEPVCLAMPLRAEAYTSHRLFPFFFNMLSEGENRKMQSALLRIDEDDDFGLLLATAKVDTIGAVTVNQL